MAKYLTKREAGRKRAWFRAVQGLVDFFASVGSFLIIMLCVALLTSLFVWLRSDVSQTLYSLESIVVDAIDQSSNNQSSIIPIEPEQ
ncbi:hypothetical protein LJC33_04545 [Eubacteriales bacterium OttesenSCG-928-N13]|nr:hypothetical protein [Eubacteriales bacterium OttesenSCG-928-N13]